MAAPVALAFRIGANLSELRANLAEAKSQLETTRQAMQKMANGLDGARLIGDANAMVKAIADIGGASKLTDAEQRRVNQTVTEALEKYRLLGREAPDDLRRIAHETRNAGKESDNWVGQLNKMAGAVGIAFSVGAVTSFAGELLRMGDEIVKVADRTGMTTDEVQKLSFIAQQSGNTIDDFTGAVGAMQNRLASGDDSALEAVKRLGINLDTLRTQSPYQELQTISEALGQIPNPATQAQLAIDLFGKTGTAILPTLKSQFGDLAKAAPLMSENTVRALDQAGDAWGKFTLTIKVMVAEAYNAVGKQFDLMIAGFYRGIAEVVDGLAKMAALAEKIPGAAKLIGGSAEYFQGWSNWFKDAATGLETTKQLTAATHAAAPAFEVVGRSVKGATSHVRENTAALKEHEAQVKLGAEGIANLGFKIDLAIPKLDAFNQAVVDLVQKTKWGADGLSDLGFRMSSGFEEGAKEIEKHARTSVRALGELAQESLTWGQAFKQALSGVAASIGQVFASGGSVMSVIKNFATNTAKEFTSTVLSFIPGIGPALSALGGPIVDGVKKLFGMFGSAGRDMVKEFAASLGGFDALHAKLGQLGAEGERLWIALTQGVGKNNKDEARAAIEEVARALDELARKQQQAKLATQEAADSLDEVSEALNSLPDEIKMRVKLEYESGGYTGGTGAAPEPVPMARGGDFIVTRPTLFLAGEAGIERATFSGAGNTGAPRGGRMLQPITIQLEGRPLWTGLIETAHAEGMV